MEDNDSLNKFKFIRRRLSVHYSIRKEIDLENNLPEGSPIKSPNRKRTIIMQEQEIKKLKDIYMKNNYGFNFINDDRLSDYNENVLDYELVEKYIKGNYDKEFQKILHILITPYNERTEADSNNLLTFFNNIKFNETIKSDTLITDLSMNELFEYFKPYISGKVFNFMDTIYYRREKSNNLYVVLHGSIGQYKLEKYEEELTCEDYYNFLSDCYNLYEEEMQMGYFISGKDDPKKAYKTTTKSITNFLNGNINIKPNIKKIEDEESKNDIQEDDDNYITDEGDKEDDNIEQYIDHYLICQMIEENKEIYPLRDISDLVRLKKIIFKLRLYMVLTESSIKDAEILYILYDFPTSYLNFDKVLNKNITLQKYIEILSNNFKLYDYFYIKLLGAEKNKVKLMKYVKTTKNLGPYDKFGNYELNDLRAKRDLTVRCESEQVVLLSIDKKMYSIAIYNAQKKKRDHAIEIMHNCYLFKNLSRKYFNNKVFSMFRIKNCFKGNVLIKQYETMNNFLFIKEGILELSLQNSSFKEFHQLIREVKEIIIKKAKELKMNQKDLFDFETEVDSKTNLHMNTIKDMLNQKQTFLFHRNEFGVFGDYEFFFEIPTILTGTIVSDKCIYYQYDKEKYNQLIQETYLLNESLRNNSFLKLKSLLKRMIRVYNSYWLLSIEQLEKKLKEKEDNMYKNEKNNEGKDSIKKSFSLSKKINKIPFLNANASNRYIYKNDLSTGGESPFSKKHFFKGIENTNFNSIKWKKMNEPNSTNNKYKFNAALNMNLIKSGNKNFFKFPQNENSGIKKRNLINGNKTTIIKETKKKKDILLENGKVNDNEKKEIKNYKLINEEEYQKKLIENFEHEMESQRVAKRKIAKRIFLPPLTYISVGKIKSDINYNYNNEKNRIMKIKKINVNEIDNKYKSKINSMDDNSNISLVINNSFSGNTSKIKIDNEETLNSNNESKINYNINKKKGISKEANKRAPINNLKIAQLYNIISRKEKKK